MSIYNCGKCTKYLPEDDRKFFEHRFQLSMLLGSLTVSDCRTSDTKISLENSYPRSMRSAKKGNRECANRPRNWERRVGENFVIKRMDIFLGKVVLRVYPSVTRIALLSKTIGI